MAKVAGPKDLRSSYRLPHSSPIDISWAESSGLKSANATLEEISVGGMRIEVSEYIPVNTMLTFRVNAIDLSGSATVRHATQRGAKFILGLELTPETRHAIGISFT